MQLCPNQNCEGGRKRLMTAKFKSRKAGIYYCKLCGITWKSSLGTFLYNIKTPVPVILKSLYKVSKGRSLRKISQEERVSIDSIYYWRDRARMFPEDISQMLRQYLNLSSSEIQEFFSVLGIGNFRKKPRKVS